MNSNSLSFPHTLQIPLNKFTVWLDVRYVFLAALPMNITVIWEVIQCNPVDIYQHFEQANCLYLHGIRGIGVKEQVPPKRWHTIYQTILCNIAKDSNLHILTFLL